MKIETLSLVDICIKNNFMQSFRQKFNEEKFVISFGSNFMITQTLSTYLEDFQFQTYLNQSTLWQDPVKQGVFTLFTIHHPSNRERQVRVSGYKAMSQYVPGHIFSGWQVGWLWEWMSGEDRRQVITASIRRLLSNWQISLGINVLQESNKMP